MNRLLQNTHKHLVTVFITLLLVGCNNTEAEKSKHTKSELNLHVPSPEWQDQIIYFLMIDRFNDGDSSNNDQGTGEFDSTNNAFFSGGDIKGITEELDYIQQLGATTIWITPPVANQWWSTHKQSTGYHGYWTKDFKNLDAHFGTIEDYQKLSSELHNREMYLIQDIVTNHTGNFFEYSGEYDSNNPQKNFNLSEEIGSVNEKPSQYPFDKIDLNNPNHKAADIYHWTPEITNFNDPIQEKFYQLSGLADLNTSNPLVVETLKQSYSYWIEKVGVDGFRIDTVKFVEHEFWNEFLHGQKGIFDSAKSTGRNKFLSFGEIFEVSPEFSDKGEVKAASYLGTEQKPELNSVIGFPLFAELNRVYAQGRPTSNLAYRIRKHMEIYPDPYIIPNFVDNHDTQRFLSDGSKDALKQALFTIFTVPGIPVIYQGTEQGILETREAMFAGGFHSDQDHFNKQAEMYQYIQRLATLRTTHKSLTRGGLKIIAEDSADSGIIAFKRAYLDEHLLVIINSADRERLVSNLATGISSNETLKTIFSENITQQSSLNLVPDNNGFLTLVLPARSMLLVSVESTQTKQQSDSEDLDSISIEQDYSGNTLSQTQPITGKVNWNASELQLVINGDLKSAKSIKVDAAGFWKTKLEVSRLGTHQNRFTIYSKNKNISTKEQHYITKLDTAEYTFEVADPIGDDKGPTGNYQPPQQEASQQQMDIEKIKVSSAGDILDIQIKMKQISTVWGPANGFDNVSFSLFFSLPGIPGAVDLPGLNTKMPNQLQWSLAHVFYGWGNSVFTSTGATATLTGQKMSAAPELSVDLDKKLIHIIYKGQAVGINDWSGVAIYISTWDKTGEGEYRSVADSVSKWNFAAENATSPKIMDDVFISIPNKINQ